jgi:hypothetical protein
MEAINRNNYEEFFLLYIDNELDAEQKLAVENFVKQNADLAVEFNMLMQTKSSAEEPIFFDKENLLRTEGNSINETNYEEYFLLYIDNELSAAKSEEVEMYVLQHPKLQDEFTTLKQTILIPEAISYNDKEALYRTERRRIIYLKPWRLAAAAIFIGVCAVGFWMMQKSSSPIIVVVNPSTQNDTKQNTAITKPVDRSKQSIQSAEKDIAQQKEETISHQSLPKKENKKVVVTASVQKKEQAKPDVAETKNNEQRINEQSVIAHNNIAEQRKEPPSTLHDVKQEPEHNEQQNEVASIQTMPGNKQEETGYNVYPVAYKELNTSDEDRSLRVGMFDLNKEKVKTFFKKAGRMFSNKSNNDNNTN